MALQEISQQLQRLIDKKIEEKAAQDRAELAAMIGISVSNAIQPFLEKIEELTNTLKNKS